MKRTELMQEIRKMRFDEAFLAWNSGKLTQAEAARRLGVRERTFRRYISRHEESGADGLIDKRLAQPSHRRAPVDEAMTLVSAYREKYDGWSVKHFYAMYRREHDGKRSYSWVKNILQSSGAVPVGKKGGTHRKRHDRSPLPGMMIHQDEWVPGKKWDLIVTMDDATWRNLRGVREVIEKRGLFCSFYLDRGSHYWNTPVAGGKVDKVAMPCRNWAWSLRWRASRGWRRPTSTSRSVIPENGNRWTPHPSSPHKCGEVEERFAAKCGCTKKFPYARRKTPSPACGRG